MIYNNSIISQDNANDPLQMLWHSVYIGRVVPCFASIETPISGKFWRALCCQEAEVVGFCTHLFQLPLVGFVAVVDAIAIATFKFG
jgi:hypothetical protein